MFMHNPRTILTVMIAVSGIILSSASGVMAYSYAEKEDPIAVIFKSAITSARKGMWDKVKPEFDKCVALQKGHLFELDYLAPRVDAAIEEMDVSKTAEVFANVVYLSIREKLHQNQNEKLSDFKNAKARLKLAHKSYSDVLDGNIRKLDPQTSAQIFTQFNLALEALGNPGLFGIGQKAPDVANYDLAVKSIEEHIEKSFPVFKE